MLLCVRDKNQYTECSPIAVIQNEMDHTINRLSNGCLLLSKTFRRFHHQTNLLLDESHNKHPHHSDQIHLKLVTNVWLILQILPRLIPVVFEAKDEKIAKAMSH